MQTFDYATLATEGARIVVIGQWLDEAVRRQIRQGWTPYGPPERVITAWHIGKRSKRASRWRVAQTMVKHGEPTDPDAPWH